MPADFPSPANNDNDLLARLNALKASSVTLDRDIHLPAAPDIEVHVRKPPPDREDLLAQRLKDLRSNAASKNGDGSGNSRDGPSLSGRISAEPPSLSANDEQFASSDHDAFGGDDEDTLESLLAELGAENQWQLDDQDVHGVKSVLSEAEHVLSEQRRETVDHAEPSNPGSQTGLPGSQGDASEQANDSPVEQDVDAEADEYIAQVLAELDLESPPDPDEDEAHPPNDDREEKHDSKKDDKLPGHDSFATAFPLLPSNAPTSPTQRSASDNPSSASHPPPPPSYEDSQLAARFASLATALSSTNNNTPDNNNPLNLPSTPTSTPGARTKKPPNPSSTSQSRKPTPAFTDNEIESWCCICNEDGEVRCLGCESDIYCHACWREGHGMGPGQERGHRAVVFTKKGPVVAA